MIRTTSIDRLTGNTVSVPTSPVKGNRHGLSKLGRSISPSPKPTEIFICPEESHFYSQCLEKFMVGHCKGVGVEFGSGDGSPVLNCLMRAKHFDGVVHGYELNPQAARMANSRIMKLGLGNHYKVHNSCFFKGSGSLANASFLIANPPYLPAPDDKIMMPALFGGVDGATLTNTLLTLGFEKVMLLVSAYSNPVSTIEKAQEHGYRVVDFMVSPLPFGTYSSEPKVKQHILKLREVGQAFYSDTGIYFLAGVLFQKCSTFQDEPQVIDMSQEFLKVMTLLK